MSLSFARATPGATRIGWIGAGVMGCSMAGHLIDAGYPLTVFNRTAAKCDPLVAKGAQLATTPAEVASASDVVFSIVGYPQGWCCPPHRASARSLLTPRGAGAAQMSET